MGGGCRVPGPDLRRPVDQRVAALGTPVVRGIGAGGEFLAGRLAMFAILFPEKLADAAMAEVERMASERSGAALRAPGAQSPHWSARSTT